MGEEGVEITSLDLMTILKKDEQILEDEKKFIITQIIAAFSTLFFLGWIFINLFYDQLNFDISEGVYFKFLYFLLLFGLFIQTSRIFYSLYNIFIHEKVLQILNIRHKETDRLSILPIIPLTFLFLILYLAFFVIYKELDLVLPIYLKIAFLICLFELASLYAFYALWDKAGKITLEGMATKEGAERYFLIGIVIGFIIHILIFICLLIGLIQLDIPPLDLLKNQVLSSIIGTIVVSFIIVKWLKPLYNRVTEIGIRLEKIRDIEKQIILKKNTISDLLEQYSRLL